MRGWFARGSLWAAIGARCARSEVAFERTASRLQRDEGGAVAVLMAILIAVILFASAFAIDVSRFTSESVQDKQALDAGLLAAAIDYRKTQDTASAVERAKAVYLANRPDGDKDDVTSITPDSVTSEVTGTTSFSWKATLLRAFGYEEVNLKARAKVKYGRLAEVVLVIDNSSFMKDHLEVFRSAALDFKTEVMGISDGSPVKVGVVPFAGAVNVGPQYRNATWVDQNAAVSYHRENYQKYLGNGAWTNATETRLELYDRMGEPWAGCLEARSGAYSGNDLAPDASKPESLFVPMFAPDEPDPGHNPSGPGPAQSHYNDYLEDYPQNDCPKEKCVKQTGRGTCQQYAAPAFTPKQWQEVSCKYAVGKMPNKTVVTLGSKKSGTVDLTTGPNFGCTSVPLQPLTRDPKKVADVLNAMKAAGGSNVAEGTLWGYRLLSPQEPFTEGSEFEDGVSEKYMIILARGANWITAYKDDLNHSIYTPWGFGSQDRLNPQSHTDQSLTNAMDELTRSACRISAEKGVHVFTIGYQVSDPHMRAMMQYCAVHPSMYLEAETPEQLRDSMTTIASKITRLHLTQ